MTPIRLYLDEDSMRGALVGALRARGVDVVTAGQSHAGIILARQQYYSVAEQMRRLLKLRSARSAEEMQNRVEFLSALD